MCKKHVKIQNAIQIKGAVIRSHFSISDENDLTQLSAQMLTGIPVGEKDSCGRNEAEL